MAVEDPERAKRMIREAIEDFRRRGVYECINDAAPGNLGKVRVKDYAVSATNVYGAYKELKHSMEEKVE